MSIHRTVPHYLNYYLCNSFEIKKCESSNFIFLDYFDYPGPLVFAYKFSRSACQFLQKQQQKQKSWDIARHSVESIGQY